MTTYTKQNYQTSMNLPVANHIDKLSDILVEMKYEIQTAQKDLHILRGQITELSFVNKQADQELNEFLIDSISSLRQKWEGEWEGQKSEILDCKKKMNKVFEEHEDIDIIRQDLEEKVDTIEGMVGIV